MPARGRMDAVRLHRRMASFLGNVLLQPHLLQPRLRITAAERNELLVVTRFDDLAILHHMMISACIAVVNRCVMMIAVRSFTRTLNRRSHSFSAQESIELVGSSRITT